MKNLRRVTVLGLFAAVGVGLAICLGFSTPPPPDGPKSQPPGGNAMETANRPRSQWQLAQPLPRPDQSVPSRRVATVPAGPVLAEPYPARGQQIIPGMGGQRLEKIVESLRHALHPKADPPGNSAPPSSDTAPSSPPAGAGLASKSGTATVDGEGDGKLSIHIPNSDIREVLDLLSAAGNLNILAGKNVQGKISATLTGVDIDSALDAILKSTGYVAKREGKFIFVGEPKEFTAMEQALDKIGTRIYRPNYVTAAELQALIEPLLTESVGVVSVSTPSEVGIGPDDAAAGGDSFAGSDAVVVRDYGAVLAEVDQLVAEIDIRPTQVHIEAMILSIKLKDTDKYGVNFELLRNKNNLKFGWGSPLNTLGEVSFEDGGLKIGFLDDSLGAFLEALETIGDTNVIATPRLMVLNKHRAEIQIGEQKGYVSTTITETSTSQSVEFLEIGAILRLRPFISSDGAIRMEIHPELSDGAVNEKAGFTLPEKEVTQVTTNIMARDGCTVVIGGLIRENLATTRNQVPFFGNLPWVGFLFRSSTETTERREVLVLITPHIIYEPQTCREGEKAACEFHRRQSTYADKMTCFNKRSIGRNYFRLAQDAWATGDRDTALRFAELSIHFDPLNRAAIDLRSDIWLGRQHGEHTLGADSSVASLPGPMDGPAIAPWLLDDLRGERVLQPAPLHPLDRGQPGTQKNIVRPRRLP